MLRRVNPPSIGKSKYNLVIIKKLQSSTTYLLFRHQYGNNLSHFRTQLTHNFSPSSNFSKSNIGGGGIGGGGMNEAG